MKKYTAIFVILITALVFSVTMNVVLFQKVNRLTKFFNFTQDYLEENELKKLQIEIDKLSNNQKYDTRTREPIQ